MKKIKAIAKLNSTRYYRSQIFNEVKGANKLLCKAQPLLLILGSINNDFILSSSSDVELFLQHEILSFRSGAQKFEYPDETIQITEWVIKTAIYDKYQQNISEVKKSTDVLTSQRKENISNVFSLVEKIILDPITHIDLLELIYICLQLGFFYNIPTSINNKKQEIVNILYQVIRNHRGSYENDFYCSHNKRQLLKTKSLHKYNLKHFLYIVTFFIAITVGAYKVIDITLKPSINKMNLLNKKIKELELI